MSLIALTRRGVHTIEAGESLAAAAKRMLERSVGALVVTDASGETPAGIVTDRDIAMAIACDLDPTTTRVGDLERTAVQTVRVDAGLGDVARQMRESGVRRLPVADAEGHLVGLVAMDDLIVMLGREMADLASAVETEIAHEQGAL